MKKNKRKIKRKTLKKRKIKVIKKRNGRDKSIDLQKAVSFNFLKLNKVYKNFVTKRKKEKEKQDKLKSKGREKQIKEEQKRLKEEEKRLKKEEEKRLQEINFVRIDHERKLREEKEEKERLDPLYKESIANAEQEKLVQRHAPYWVAFAQVRGAHPHLELPVLTDRRRNHQK